MSGIWVSRGPLAQGWDSRLCYFTRRVTAEPAPRPMRRLPSPARPHRHLLAAALVLGAALSAAGADAAEVSLYEVSVPLRGAGEAERAVAFAEAIKAVAVRVSGRRDAAANATVTAADPALHVQRYTSGTDLRLSVGFDDASVDRLLQQAGLTFWAAERPLTLVDVNAEDRSAAIDAAQWRGLPIAWQAGAVAIGPAQAVLRGTPSGAQFDWTFTHVGETVQARGSLADGVHLAADTLAARYAPPSSRGTSSLVLRVAGMDDVGRYAGVLAYLESLSLVRSVAVEALEGDVLRLRVSVRGDRELLGRIAALDGKLEPVAGDAEPAADADFSFEP